MDGPQKKSYTPKNKGRRAGKPYTKASEGHGKIRGNMWGWHAVVHAWTNPARQIGVLFCTEAAWTRLSAEQLPEAIKSRPKPIFVSKHELDQALPGAVHQGLLIRAEPLPEQAVSDLIIRTRDKARVLFIMLDQVTDPHNVGAVMRSAAAFGADGMIVQNRYAPELTGVLAKTACGAVEHLPVIEEVNLSRTLEQLKDAGFLTVGLDERGSFGVSEAVQGNHKICLVLGAEGDGIRQKVAETCDRLARLPTQPPIYSLNVSNAAAIAIFACQP